MEDMTQFIFGMVTMIGVAAIVTLVVGIVKVFKANTQIKHLWSSIDSQNNSMWQERENTRRVFEEDFRLINSRIDEVHRTIDSNFNEIDRRVDHAIENVNDRIDDIESSIENVNDKVNDIESSVEDTTSKASENIVELIDDLTEDLRDDINSLRDDIEEKARNSQSYIDSRFDKFEAKMTAEKAAKKVLKG